MLPPKRANKELIQQRCTRGLGSFLIHNMFSSPSLSYNVGYYSKTLCCSPSGKTGNYVKSPALCQNYVNYTDSYFKTKICSQLCSLALRKYFLEIAHVYHFLNLQCWERLVHLKCALRTRAAFKSSSGQIGN